MPTTREQATALALTRAQQALFGIDLAARCPNLGLALPDASGVIALRALGNDYALDTTTFTVTGPTPCPPPLEILLLRYLSCEQPLDPDGEPISFRAFPGGAFYIGPYIARTSEPLTRAFDNDLERLQQSLDTLDWTPLPLGDLGARIHAYGELFLTLVYHVGDEEFPASADLLFNPCATRILTPDEAAMLGGLVAGRLLRG